MSGSETASNLAMGRVLGAHAQQPTTAQTEAKCFTEFDGIAVGCGWPLRVRLRAETAAAFAPGSMFSSPTRSMYSTVTA